MKKLISIVLLLVTILTVGCGNEMPAANSKIAETKPAQEVKINPNMTAADLYETGMRYYNGKDVQKDHKVASKFILAAAEKGHVKAQLKMGDMYRAGEVVSITDRKIRDEKALEWYKKAADQNDLDAIRKYAAVNSGPPDGITRDYKTAFKYYKIAAEMGDIWAQTRVAYHYEYGIGVSKDNEKAKYWRVKAARQELKRVLQMAEQGDAKAQFRLGLIYYVGNEDMGIKKDYKQTVYWYQKAADQQDLLAMLRLSEMYEGGLGVSKDEKKAAELKAKANELIKKMK